MKYKIYSILLGIILFGTNNSYTQSIFTTKEEVAEYLVGEWNLDVVQGGFAGVTFYLPSPYYYDSTFHKIVFEESEIDSTPLVCKAYIDDTLFQMTYVKISENPSQIILPRWLLFDMPENIGNHTTMAESDGFYGFSQDTMVLGFNGADGYAYGLSRLTTSVEETNQYVDVNIYPNPATDFINIDVKGQLNYQVNLYDLEGRLIITATNSSQISTESFSEGTYLLEIKDINSVHKRVEKVVIIK